MEEKVIYQSKEYQIIIRYKKLRYLVIKKDLYQETILFAALKRPSIISEYFYVPENKTCIIVSLDADNQYILELSTNFQPSHIISKTKYPIKQLKPGLFQILGKGNYLAELYDSYHNQLFSIPSIIRQAFYQEYRQEICLTGGQINETTSLEHLVYSPTNLYDSKGQMYIASVILPNENHPLYMAPFIYCVNTGKLTFLPTKEPLPLIKWASLIVKTSLFNPLTYKNSDSTILISSMPEYQKSYYQKLTLESKKGV